MLFRNLILLIGISFYPLFCDAQSTISLEEKREIFVDDYLISKVDNVELKLHKPVDEGPVLYFDKPWEGNFSTFTTIVKDGDLFRAYYRGMREPGQDSIVVAYAESDDGIEWRKPGLGIYEVENTLQNNVVLLEDSPITSNFSPFLDTNPNVNPSQRYKAVGGDKDTGLLAYVSEDGLRWKKLQEKPIISDGAFDSQNVVFWSEAEQHYVCYFRTWTEGIYEGLRTVSRATSTDFIHWSDPKEMSFSRMLNEHLYTQQTSPYYRAPHIYIAIGGRFVPGRQVLTEEEMTELNVYPNNYKDLSDAYFMTTRGGNRYDRTFMESFIRPGIGLENWVSRSNFPALNIVQTSPTRMSVYVNKNYSQPTSYLNRYSLRIDGFTSLSADYDGGEIITKAFTFRGDELEINYSTSVVGEIKIEIQNADGKPISGFTLSDSEEIFGNEIKRIVSWNGNTDVSTLASKPIRLRIYLKDADLYSIKFN